jgi:hypothetical protein
MTHIGDTFFVAKPSLNNLQSTKPATEHRVPYFSAGTTDVLHRSYFSHISDTELDGKVLVYSN